MTKDGMREGRTVADEISPERREHLMQLHRPLQKTLFLVAGPASVVLYAISAYMTPIWQNFVMLAAVIALFAAWGIALLLTRSGQLEKSVYLFMASVLGFEGLEIMMMDGAEATELLGCFAVVAYAGLFTRRGIYASAAGLAGIIVLSELAKNLAWYPIYVVPPADRLMQQIPFTFLLMWLAVHIIRRGQVINERMYAEVQSKSRVQEEIIRAATRLQPVIDRVSGQLRTIANGFVAQSTEHAATTSEVSTTIEHILKSAGDSAAAAGKANAIAEGTRERSIHSRDRLLAVQRGFGEVAQAMSASSEAIENLTRQAQNIEEILHYNREIGEHIKVLAVNAAIEAASAGDYGKGFRVVADELREMIVKTDANLVRSGQLLDAISKQARENVAATQKSSASITQYYEELRATGELIDSITEAFVTTSGQIGAIADAVQREVSGIDQVRLGIAQIDAAATELEGAARVLLEGVEEITASHGELRTVLEGGKTALAPQGAAG